MLEEGVLVGRPQRSGFSSRSGPGLSQDRGTVWRGGVLCTEGGSLVTDLEKPRSRSDSHILMLNFADLKLVFCTQK